MIAVSEQPNPKVKLSNGLTDRNANDDNTSQTAVDP